MNAIKQTDTQGSSLETKTQKCRPASKWAANVNDRLIPMPSRHVKAVVVFEQGKVPAGHQLFRDHNSENDPQIGREELIDLGQGNVFYSQEGCECEATPACKEPAKLAFVVNDRWELVIDPNQTGESIRNLFNLDCQIQLFRDLESPDDVLISDSTGVHFSDGCVFRTNKGCSVLRITVNKRVFSEKDGVKAEMTGSEIAKLVEDKPESTRVERVTDGQKTPIGLDERIKIANCDEFKVIRCNVNAGFQAERLERELSQLIEGGAKVTLLEGSMPAVIYHEVPVRAGLPVPKTDVLVKIPGGYPGALIDNAFLPADSPLLNQTPGAVQQTENYNGSLWTQKSIHPHAGAGVAWDKNRHGFHTYYSEILNWLNQR